jgi:hypothetical protein
MLRQFLLSLALIGLFATSVGGDEQGPDVATWRWHENTILNAQRADPPLTIGAAYDFRQKYERYAPNGMPEAPHGLAK